MTRDLLRAAEKAAASVRKKYKGGLHTAVILGSGLGGAAYPGNAIDIPYTAIKGFPAPGVKGHEGILKLADGKAFMLGRFHFYEGQTPLQLMLPVFMLHALGVNRLIVTNAAGSLRRRLRPGDIVFIRDQINLLGVPLFRGADNGSAGPRFINMENAYSQRLARAVKKLRPRVRKQGVYVCMPGPQYETRAEARMLRILGGDMVGMSTVPEVMAARYLGMEVLGFSCITNFAAGVGTKPVDHEQVLRVSEGITGRLRDILEAITALPQSETDDRS
jgi:purine-nucleoside phosphorylase